MPLPYDLTPAQARMLLLIGSLTARRESFDWGELQSWLHNPARPAHLEHHQVSKTAHALYQLGLVSEPFSETDSSLTEKGQQALCALRKHALEAEHRKRPQGVMAVVRVRRGHQ